MFLLVGLGNPGPDYASNRHNIGFMAVDEIARKFSFSPWRKKFQGWICEGLLGSQKALLLKPATYMNESGRSIAEVCRFYKIAPEQIYVFHDELDLAPGKVKAKRGGGAAGHNGLKSTCAHIGPDFNRIRLGIGHPGKERVTQWVLGDFSKAEQQWLEPLIEALGANANSLVKGDLGRFLTDLSQTLNPPLNGHKKTKAHESETRPPKDNKTGKKEKPITKNASMEQPKTAMADALTQLFNKQKDD